MQQAAQISITALTPQQLTVLTKEKSILQGKLQGTLDTIDLEVENLESELRNMMKKQKKDKDELEYVGLIKDAIAYRVYIKSIEVWINQGLGEADYEHRIIKALGFTKPKPRSPSPKLSPVVDQQRETYTSQVNKLTNHPFSSGLLDLYDLGMTDLNANLRALEKYQGDIEQAYNFLLDSEQDQPVVDPYIQKVQQIQYPQQRKDLELLYMLKFTNFEENLDAITEASGDIEAARKILVQKHRQNNQQRVAKLEGVPSLEMSFVASSQQSLGSYMSQSEPLRDSQNHDGLMEQYQVPKHEEIKQPSAPVILDLGELQLHLRDQLEKEGLTSIDEVRELLYENYELEKDPLTKLRARKSIPKYQDMLSTQIEIWKLMIKPAALQLKLDEDITLEDVLDLIDQRAILLEGAKKKGDSTRASKLATEIDQYQMIKDMFEGIEKFEKAKNGIQDPLADPKVLYPTLPLEKRLSLLSKLLQQSKIEVYSELLANDIDLENSEAFKAVLNSFKSLIQGSKWDRLSVGLFKTFLKTGDVTQHFAMKIYLMQDQTLVISPVVMNQAYQAIQQINVPPQCEETHQEFIDNFTALTVDQIVAQVDVIAKERKDYASMLAEIIKPLRPFMMPDTALVQQLNGYDGEFKKYQTFAMAKNCLFNRDVLGSSQLIRNLISQIVGEHQLEQGLCEMYALIIKAQPEFERALSDEELFTSFAPPQLADAVSELLQLLKQQLHLAGQQKDEDSMRVVQQDGQVSKVISEKLTEIFYEDARFNEMLVRYLTESTDYNLVVTPYLSQIKTIKSLHLEHLELAISQIEARGSRPQRIAEFLAVNIDQDFQALQTNIAKLYHNYQKLDGKDITLVLHDLIKKRSTFDQFINHLSQNNKDGSLHNLFTQQFFLSYLLNNSDTYLRTMILMACSFFMPVPMVSYQPMHQNNISKQLSQQLEKSGGGIMKMASQSGQNKVPEKKAEIKFYPHVYEELFYCFEKHMAVLSFKVSANPNKSPQGCTSLTNYVFNRTFQAHSRSLVNYGSIEIQFDYNFEEPMFVPVADAHGLVEEDILERVYPLFNIFMIHSFEGAEHQKVVKKHIIQIHQKTKNPLIFLFIHSEGKSDNSFAIEQDGNIVKIMLTRYTDLHRLLKENLRNTIVKHYLKHIGDFKAYEANIPARLNSLQDFADFAQSFQAYKRQSIDFEEEKSDGQGVKYQEQMQLSDVLDITGNFMRMIEENKERLRSAKVLPMNVLFEEACQLERIMIRDTSLTEEIFEQHSLRVEQLYQQMTESMPSPLTQELRKIINHRNYIGLASIISKLTRSLVNSNLQPLIKEREELGNRVLLPDLNQGIKEDMYERIGEISKTLEKLWFSNEFLYREYYISDLSQLRGSVKLPALPSTDYLSLASLQISQGQPFEIIDGINHHFIKEVYQRIQTDQMQSEEEEIIVVSVVGPQSSGKTHLLNSLFGTQFLSQRGRSTRGIQGCLIDIYSQIKSQKMLILDTECIQSADAVDDDFDKRFMFYLLSMSHVVLICNLGEMNESAQDTIKLATDCIMQLREKVDHQPRVNIIMNNVQITQDLLSQTTQSLSQTIKEIQRQDDGLLKFKIDESNVFLLPNAFELSGIDEFAAHHPSVKHAQQVDLLRESILTFMQSRASQDQNAYTLEYWFQKAQQFWEFTDVYQEFTEYSTEEERNQDILVQEYSKKLIAKYFQDRQMVQKHENMIKKEVTQVLDQHEGFDQTNVNVIKSQIDDVLKPKIQEVEALINDEFGKFIEKLGISPKMKRRRVDELNIQIRLNLLDWQQLVESFLRDFMLNKTQLIAEKSLLEVVDRYTQANHAKRTYEEAEQVFKTQWERIMNGISMQVRTKQEIFDGQFDYVAELYHGCISNKTMIDQERALIAQYQGLNGKILRNKLRSQKAFFQHKQKLIKPSMELFKGQIAREKHFLSNKIDFFEEIKNDQEYNAQLGQKDQMIQGLKLNQKKGQEQINRRQTYLTIKPELRKQDQYFAQYIEYLVHSGKPYLSSASKPVEHALYSFYGLLDHDKLLKNIQSIVLENLLRNPKDNKDPETVEEIVEDLVAADDPKVSQEFCSVDIKVIQRVVAGVKGIVDKINEDMEPYRFIVSDQGCICLHQIAQTYIIRIMQEVARLEEHAPLLTFNKTKDTQRDIFIAKLIYDQDKEQQDIQMDIS